MRAAKQATSIASTWETFWNARFTSEFAKSPAARIIVGVVLLIIKDRYDRRQTRRTLLRAVHTESRTTWQTVHDLLERFPSRAEADVIVDGVKTGKLTFEILDNLPAGCTFYVPSFPLSFTSRS